MIIKDFQDRVLFDGLISDLRGAVLRGAVLEGADLRGADLRGAVLEGAVLREADLREADLEGADLRGAVLEGADLRGAVLREADLRGAVLEGADLRGAVLREADLRGAVLEGAVLREADLRGADLEIPVIEDIHTKVLASCEVENALDMSTWHKEGFCGTTHCQAGWVVHLAGEAGRELEKKTSTSTAAYLIYRKSDPRPYALNFYASNEEALENMRALAAM